jgi:hypothetical protein
MPRQVRSQRVDRAAHLRRQRNEIAVQLRGRVLSFRTHRIAELEGEVLRGDPGLLKWARNEQPPLPRPDFADAQAFRACQSALRFTLLTEVFRMPDITSPVEVRFRRISTEQVAPGDRVFSPLSQELIPEPPAPLTGLYRSRRPLGTVGVAAG